MLFAVALLAHGIQPAVDAAFANRAGSAVVVSVDTGRAVASRHANVAAARPGSAIKPFVLEALREHGAADARMACPVRLRIAGKELDCTHPRLNEPVDAHKAVAYSCNNWFAESSRRIGAADLRQTLLRFGFTGVDLAATDDAKRLQALGEAGVHVTPLEMASAYRKLALGGDLIQDLTAAAEFGTAQLASPVGVPVAAKTGTTSDGAWLAGWIPADKPKYVVVVYLPAGSGGSDAAPVARRIFAALAPDPRGVKVEADGAVLDVPFEEYVAGVVAGEAGVMRSAESLKAMAVAARTWAAALRGRHQGDGFDFCSTTHCQEYRPSEVSQAAVAAVRATAGEMLWWQGRPVFAYYSRDCGGMTEASEDVWPELKTPYLIRHPDPWCRSQGRNEWRAEIEKKALSGALHTPVGAVRVVARTPSGRVARISLGGATETGAAFRFDVGRQLGWNLVRSDAFEVVDEGSRVVLRGTGAGHGVGMCQTGAAHMGE
jgi:SpoIID/LytB domain protein